MNLFPSGYAYPNDGTGAYVDLYGEVVSVEPIWDRMSEVTVRTPEGIFTGYTEMSPLPTGPNLYAGIRVYDSGGGFYPDNEICQMGPKDAVLP